ncbi:MAG: hypothetical protein PHS80_02945 [Methanothrix sp.]|nr:hypothetical protein [Methanothrix sp.]MDD4447016.1 hypothetical protein [Methanothrix sp.]
MRPSIPGSKAIAAHSLSAEALGLDEFKTLQKEKAYLASAFGVPAEIRSADDQERTPRARANRRNRGGRRGMSNEVLFVKPIILH